MPRAPLRHPDTEPLVYAMTEAQSPIYLFPRDCPRIATWVAETTSADDAERFQAAGPARIKSYIDRGDESAWRGGQIYRYTFDSDGFEDGQDYGNWVSRSPQTPRSVELITDLPAFASEMGMSVQVVDSLADLGRELFDFEAGHWRTTLHVSMIRMNLLSGWNHRPAKP